MAWTLLISVMKKSGSHYRNENTIVSDNNIENHSTDECVGEESSEEDERSGDDKSLKNKILRNHMTSQSDISKDHHLHDQGQYERLYTWLYFNNALRE